MSDNPYDLILPSGAFSKALDRAIAESNQAFLDDQEAQVKAQEEGDRWRHLLAAEDAAAHHGIVLPIATAEAILSVLRGEMQPLGDLLEKMVAAKISTAATKKGS